MSFSARYSVLPFLGNVRSGAQAGEVARQLEALLNRAAAADADLALVSAAYTRIAPGCLAGLTGKKADWARHDQVIVTGNAALAAASTPPFASASETPTAVQPLETAKRLWNGLPRNVRHAIIGFGAMVVLLTIFDLGRHKTSAPTAPPVAVEPPAQVSGSSATVPPPARVVQPAPAITRPEASPAETVLPEPTQPVSPPTEPAKAPSVRVGDRWITDVVDHQDDRLSYRSERVVTDAQAGRIVTTVRSLKSNYVRTVSYDDQWGLLATSQQSGSTTRYEPALPYLSFPLHPGKTWRARVVETGADGAQKVHVVNATVGPWETITVPAGTFTALKVVISDDVTQNDVLVSQGQDVSWYAPEVRRSVRTEETSLDPKTGERRQRTLSLIEYSLH